jgi:hypothetical protein
MKYYFLKLLPPRPTFAQDITPAELLLMQTHGVYWAGLLSQGKAVAFGLVGDPTMPYGMGLLELPDADDPRALTAADPVVEAGVGFNYEICPLRGHVRPRG